MQKQAVHMGMGWKAPAVARHIKATTTNTQPSQIANDTPPMQQTFKVNMGTGWLAPSVVKHLK